MDFGTCCVLEFRNVGNAQMKPTPPRRSNLSTFCPFHFLYCRLGSSSIQYCTLNAVFVAVMKMYDTLECHSTSFYHVHPPWNQSYNTTGHWGHYPGCGSSLKRILLVNEQQRLDSLCSIAKHYRSNFASDLSQHTWQLCPLGNCRLVPV